jgi:hypothetical protein
MHYFIRTALLLFLSGISCTRHLSNDESKGQQGYADSQVVGTWKVTAYVSSIPYDWNGDGRTETNIFATWSSCQQDNRYQFLPDKTGQFQVSCSLSGPGTWQIINTLFLYYTLTGQSPDAEKIISMTSVEFKTIREITVSTGQNITLTKTWTRQ